MTSCGINQNMDYKAWRYVESFSPIYGKMKQSYGWQRRCFNRTASNNTWKWFEIIGQVIGSNILFYNTYHDGVEVTEETPVTVPVSPLRIWPGVEPFEYELDASSADWAKICISEK
jgi:hypothetical protein